MNILTKLYAECVKVDSQYDMWVRYWKGRDNCPVFPSCRNVRPGAEYR